MNSHVIRNATADDAAQILELRERSILALGVGDYAEEQIDAWVGKRIAAEYQQWIEKSPFFAYLLPPISLIYRLNLTLITSPSWTM